METSPVNPWWRRSWGVIIISAGVFVLIFVIILAALTARYWWQIKRGRGAELAAQFASGFTSSLQDSGQNIQYIDRARLETADDPFLGRPKGAGAPITVVEFIDFKCPNSKRAASIIRRVAARYPRQLSFIVRDVPVESAYPGTTQLAELAACAQEQGAYWPLYDWLYKNQDSLPSKLTAEAVAGLAEEIGLKLPELTACLESPRPAREVKQDYVDAISFGVRGTPTFFINGRKVEGVISEEGWRKIVESVK